MAYEVRVPPLGQTSDEMVIASWLKQEGDEVRIGEPLLEVDTDKATLEVEAVADGTLLQIVHREGAEVSVGMVIAIIGDPAERDAVTAPAPARQQVKAIPAARKLAREHAVDLAAVAGTGPDGAILPRDVLAAAGDGAAGVATVPVPRARRAIAARLQQSVRDVPQFTVGAGVRMEAARAQLDEQRRAGLEGLTFTHLVLRAVGAALRAHPTVNQRWIADGPSLLPSARADVGLAVATDAGVLVAAIDEPDAAALDELVTAVSGAVEQARRGVLASAGRQPMATVSNLGMFGVERFTAILDPEQTAILAVGGIAERPVAEDGELRIREIAEVSLTVDHRVVDGAEAGRFVATVKRLLESGEPS